MTERWAETVMVKSSSGDAPTNPGERFVTMGHDVGALVAVKNAAYGDSAARCGQCLAVLYPDGLRPDQYNDAMLVVRILDKLSRIATARDALGENPYQDIAGYGLLGMDLHRRGEQ